MPNNQSDWAIDSFRVYEGRQRPLVNGSIAGPDRASLSVQVELGDDYESLTVGEIKEMIFAKARELYPSN